MHNDLILGLWPIAGITTLGVTPHDAKGTIQAAIDCGIRSFDTAFSYGFDGESDRYLGEAIHPDRDAYHVFGKVGQRWTNDRVRIVNGQPSQLIADAEESLARMKTDYFNLLFLHSPDPNTPLCDSAKAMQTLKDRGLCQRIGICNVDSGQLREFCNACECDAIQAPLNRLQSDSLRELIPCAKEHQCSSYVYWTLMKGLLAGQITRAHVFAKGDSRPGYDVFQGSAREEAHQVIDGLAKLGRSCDQTVAQLSVGWALSQPGVNGAIVGARRPEQIRELASSRSLDESTLCQIDAIFDSIH